MIHHYDVISIFMTSFLFFDIFCFTTQSFHRIFVKLAMYSICRKPTRRKKPSPILEILPRKKVDVIISPQMKSPIPLSPKLGKLFEFCLRESSRALAQIIFITNLIHHNDVIFVFMMSSLRGRGS